MRLMRRQTLVQSSGCGYDQGRLAYGAERCRGYMRRGGQKLCGAQSLVLMPAAEQYVWWAIEEDYVRIPLAFRFNERCPECIDEKCLECIKPAWRFEYDGLSGADIYCGAQLIILLRKERGRKWVAVHACRLPQHICRRAAETAEEMWLAGGWKEDVAEAVESLRFD